MTDSPTSSTMSLTRGSDASFNSFTPGAHRRSHPNLHHMSFAPLTPKYPITPSDYDAYVDPSTNSLHTSTSLTQISSLPGPSGLLSVPTTPGGSRSPRTSASLSRPTKSHVSLADTKSPGTSSTPKFPSGAVTSAGLGGRLIPTTSFHHKSQSNATDYPSWLIQTGLVLTDSSRESKGQSWLTKRASSTSLHSPATGQDANGTPRTEYFTPTREGGRSLSARTTPAGSRRNSRARRSGGLTRQDLAMTQAVAASASASVTEPHPTTIPAHQQTRSFTSMAPQWTDSQSLAEEASLQSLHNKLTSSIYSEEDGSIVEDEEQEEYDPDEEKQEEKEIQKQFRERGFVFGRWFDRAVDTLLMFEDDPDEAISVGSLATGEKERVVGVRLQDISDITANASTADVGERVVRIPQEGKSIETEGDALADMEPAPANPVGVWEDVKWFGRLVWGTRV